jgi:hypothetical protein
MADLLIVIRSQPDEDCLANFAATSFTRRQAAPLLTYRFLSFGFGS